MVQLLFGAALVLCTALPLASTADNAFATQWVQTDPINTEWLRHASWTDGIPDGASTAIVKGNESNPFEICLKSAGINGKGDHPAGVLELTHGATIIIEKGGALDFSGDFDFSSVIKAFGRPPVSKTGGRDWGNDDEGIIPPDDTSNDDEDSVEGEKTSTGSIAGIVAALVLVFIGVAVFAVQYTKRNSNTPDAIAMQPPAAYNNPTFNNPHATAAATPDDDGLYGVPPDTPDGMAQGRVLAPGTDGYEPPADGYAVGTQANGNTVYATYAGSSGPASMDSDGYAVAADGYAVGTQANGNTVYATYAGSSGPASMDSDGYAVAADGYAVGSNRGNSSDYDNALDDQQGRAYAELAGTRVVYASNA